MSMGFIVNDTCTHASRVLRAEDCMLRFDSGDGITFDDAVHHLLVLGTTGSGKTASVVLPAIYRLLAAWHCGFVADIKGNMRAQVRALAGRCGREGDIVEYGTGPAALRLNILSGMDRHAMYSFFETLTLQSFRNASDQLDWHLKGVNVAADCGHLLLLLSGLDPMFEPNIVTISEMLMRPAEALKLYKLFRTRVYDRTNEEHALFVGSVEANRFHVLKARSENGKSSETTTDEQMTWTLQSVRQALKSFLDAPGIAEH
ncbi:MAG: type IV secretory system conjugative DNA transfer family protein, partial [Desulfovibrio sp.]|nr:type IV secretory system conjugative DNA transfer family protein [Desulfovibrio sp.]